MSESVLAAILEASELQPTDRVLEVGPGLGALTAQLLDRAGCVLAVELDESLLEVLRAELGSNPKLHLHRGHILTTPFVDCLVDVCPGASYKIVANLPYYITSHALRRFLEAEPPAELIVVMVQREVAQRAVARPPDMGLLAVSVQYYSDPKIVAKVPASAFVPQPEVDSAVLQLRPHEPLFPDIPTERYFEVVAAGFGQKRKTLQNSLSSNLRLPKEVVAEALKRGGVDPRARAEQLSLDDWARICRQLPAS